MRPGKSLLMYLCSKFILSPPCHHLLDLVRLHRDELHLVGLCGARLRGRRRPPRCHLARSPTPQPEPQPHIPLMHHGDRPPQLPKLSVPLPDCVGAAASPRAASPNRPSAADPAGSAAPPLFPVGFDSAARAARFPMTRRAAPASAGRASSMSLSASLTWGRINRLARARSMSPGSVSIRCRSFDALSRTATKVHRERDD